MIKSQTVLVKQQALFYFNNEYETFSYNFDSSCSMIASMVTSHCFQAVTAQSLKIPKIHVSDTAPPSTNMSSGMEIARL